MTTYFFDNCIAPTLAKAFQTLGESVVHLQDRFAANTVDTVWMPQVAQLGLLVVSGDRRLWTRPHERKVLDQVDLIVFFMPKSYPRFDLWSQLAFLVKCWPHVLATKTKAGDCFDVHIQTGKVEPLVKK